MGWLTAHIERRLAEREFEANCLLIDTDRDYAQRLGLKVDEIEARREERRKLREHYDRRTWSNI